MNNDEANTLKHLSQVSCSHMMHVHSNDETLSRLHAAGLIARITLITQAGREALALHSASAKPDEMNPSEVSS